jgi:hypothetical protein
MASAGARPTFWLWSDTERSQLALWISKTAIVRNAASNYRRIFPRNTSYIFKQRRIPPESTWMLACAQPMLVCLGSKASHCSGSCALMTSPWSYVRKFTTLYSPD